MPNERDIEKAQVKAQVEELERSGRAEVSQPLTFDSLFETVYVSTGKSTLGEQPADETPQAEEGVAQAESGADSYVVQSADIAAPTYSGSTARIHPGSVAPERLGSATSGQPDSATPCRADSPVPTPSGSTYPTRADSPAQTRSHIDASVHPEPTVPSRSQADFPNPSDPPDASLGDSPVPPGATLEATRVAEASPSPSGTVPSTEPPSGEPAVSQSAPDAFFGFDLMATIGIAGDTPAEQVELETSPPDGSFDSAEPASASGAAKTASQPEKAQPASGASRESCPTSLLSTMPTIPSALRAPVVEASVDRPAPAEAVTPTKPTVEAPPDTPAPVAAARPTEAADATASDLGDAPVDAVDPRSIEPSRRRASAEPDPAPASKEEDAVSAAARAAAVEWRRQKGRTNTYSDSPRQRAESPSAKTPAESTRLQRRGLAEPDGSPRRTDVPNGDRVRAAQPAPSGGTRSSAESGGPHAPAERAASPETTAALPAIKNGRHARDHGDESLAQSAQRIRAAVASVSGVPLGDELRSLTKDAFEGGSKPLTVTPESAEQEHAAQKSGARDPDTKFFAATMSIEEGMEKADKAHAHNVKMWTRVAAAMLLVVVGGVGLTAAFSLSLSGLGNDGESSPPAAPAPSAPDVSGKAAPVVPEDQTSGEKATGKAGTVVYSYTGHVGEGGTYVVTESVEFADDGTSAQTTIEGTFGNAATAEQFLEAVKRDYGSDFLEGTAEGEHVVVKVDISKLGLDREAYEDALRDSVDDLRVVKKS